MASPASANVVRPCEETAATGARPLAKARPRFSCATCRDTRCVHFEQDDVKPGGTVPCPDCANDEWADALERASFR